MKIQKHCIIDCLNNNFICMIGWLLQIYCVTIIIVSGAIQAEIMAYDFLLSLQNNLYKKKKSLIHHTPA